MAKKGDKNGRKNQRGRVADANDAQEVLDQQRDEHGMLPSQAEGERELAEDALNDHTNNTGDGDQHAAVAPLQEPKETPSQAEGEREIVEEALRRQNERH